MKIEEAKQAIKARSKEMAEKNAINSFGHIPVQQAIPISDVIKILDQIDQPKPVVPQVAIDYYNEYKNVLSSFDEWFCGFYDDKFDEEFEKAEELRIWLYDNDNKINLQHELALATLIVNGPDAVTVQKEKLYTVEIPNPNTIAITALKKSNVGDVVMCYQIDNYWKNNSRYQLTEAEIRKDFDWAFRWAEEVTE